jgi:hypothetical protein
MKIHGKHELLAQIARRGLMLGALLAMLLSFADISFAQSDGPATSARDVKRAAVPASTTPTTAAVAMPTVPTVKPMAPAEENTPAKGQREGIIVHGHWTIEVRNPEGRVVTHREFENSFLDQDVLAGLLGHASAAGGLSITLLGTCGTINYPARLSPVPLPPGVPYTGPGCVLYESDSPAFTAPFFNDLTQAVPNYLGTNTLGYGIDCSNGNPNCYGVLSASSSPGSDVLTLQGTAPLPTTVGTGSISAVYANIYTCAPSNSPSACANASHGLFGGIAGITGPLSGSFTLTGTTLPSAVPVSGGQSVSVTVQISFSSK